MITRELLIDMVDDWNTESPNDEMTIELLMEIMGINENDIVEQ